MASDALTRLLNATRPYKPFSVKIGDDTFEYFARRPGSIESARVSKAFDEAYHDSKQSQGDPDYTSLYTLLKRQDNDKLASFIVKADKRDYLQEASMLNNDAPLDDERVIKDADELANVKHKEYVDMPHDDLLSKAWERREHFQAIEDGQNAANYMMAVVTLYTQEGNAYLPLFDSIDTARQLPINSLVAVMTEAFKVIAEDQTDSPLPSAPSTSSGEPTQLPDVKAAE